MVCQKKIFAALIYLKEFMPINKSLERVPDEEVYPMAPPHITSVAKADSSHSIISSIGLEKHTRVYSRRSLSSSHR